MSKAPKLRFKEFSGDWESKKLEDVTSYVDYRGKTPPKSESGIFLVTAKNIKQGYIDYSASQEFISEESYDEAMRRGLPQKGDVLLTTEAPLGNVAQIDREDIALAQRVIKFRGTEEVDNTFLKYYFLSEEFQNKLFSKAIGTTVLGIQGKVLHKMLVSLPTIEEQEKIASFISLIDDKISLQGEKVEALKDYKTGMMQKIFSRKLRFKDDEGRNYPEWEEKKLSEVSDVRDGTHDSPKYVESGYRFITSKNLSSNGKIDFSDISYISEEDYININKRSKVDIGDILFGMIGTIGNPVLVEESEFAIKNVALIKEKDDLLNKYLIQVLNSSIISRQFYTLNSGGTQKFIALGVIRDLVIPVPNKEEQIKIANFLCNLDKRIDKEQEKLDSLNEYKKGLLQQMFV